MGCADPAAQHQEGAFIAALGVVHNVYRSESGNGLDLSDGRTGVVLTLIPAPVTADLPLEGTTWTLDSLISAPAGAGQPGSVSSTTFGTPPVTITISGGALSGKACNSFGGTVTLSADNRIHVSQLESTAMACGDDEMTQEATVFATLAAIETYTIAGARLLLMAPDGTGLGFTGA
jgi:heat shock protein HslJ